MKTLVFWCVDNYSTKPIKLTDFYLHSIKGHVFMPKDVFLDEDACKQEMIKRKKIELKKIEKQLGELND